MGRSLRNLLPKSPTTRGTIKQTALLTTALGLICLGYSSCVLVPFIEPDKQAVRGNNYDNIVTSPQPIPIPGVQQTKRTGPKGVKVAKYLKQLGTGSPVQRTHAAYWVGEQRLNEAEPLLIRNLQYNNVWVRRSAAKALGKLGLPTSVEPLIGTLRDRDKYVAHTAANSLRKIGTKRAMQALRSYRGI